MKKLINSKGVGKVELMICLCAILVLLAIGIKSLSDNHSKGNISMFKKLGDSFAYEVSFYKDKNPTPDNVYYLDNLLDDNYDVELSNPTNASEECSRYETYVKIDGGNKKEVVLKCGSYLAVGVQDGSYSVYELSEWSEKSDGSLEEEVQVFYNYKKDGVEASENYMIQKEFLDFYNEKESKMIYYPEDASSENVELLSKTLYRSKKLIKKID